MTDFETISVDLGSDGLATLTITRPKALNALNEQVLTELSQALEDLAARDLRALIVTGEGRAFIAGADIKAMMEMSADEALTFGHLGHSVMNALQGLPFPTIAAVNGFALGGGLELALSCDLIYLSEKAKVGLPEVGLGIIPGFGGTQRLGRRIGWHHARRLVFTGATIDAAEALRIGLALEVFPADEFMDKVRDVATAIASQGPVAVRRAREVMARGAELPLEDANRAEVEAFAGLWDTADRAEGMAAFVDRRDVDFQGA